MIAFTLSLFPSGLSLSSSSTGLTRQKLLCPSEPLLVEGNRRAVWRVLSVAITRRFFYKLHVGQAPEKHQPVIIAHLTRTRLSCDTVTSTCAIDIGGENAIVRDRSAGRTNMRNSLYFTTQRRNTKRSTVHAINVEDRSRKAVAVLSAIYNGFKTWVHVSDQVRFSDTYDEAIYSRTEALNPSIGHRGTLHSVQERG